jgi:hypothetical protein
VLLAAGLLTGAGTASATESHQIWAPSTDTQPFGTFHLGVDTHTTFVTPPDEGGYALPTVYGLTVGVVETPLVSVEVGIDLKEVTMDPWYFNVKAQLKEESLHEFSPAVAVGVFDIGTNPDETMYAVAYGLIAKTLPAIGRLSIGYYYGNEELLTHSDSALVNHGFMLSWDRRLPEIDDRLWIAIDYMDGENRYGAVSFGGAWQFTPHVSILGGYIIYNNNDIAGENLFTIQVDIDI